MKEMLFLNCKDKITLGCGEKVMVSFPGIWVYAELEFIEGSPNPFKVTLIIDGERKVIRLKAGKSTPIHIKGQQRLHYEVQASKEGTSS
jgi:hypothetical protein